AIFVSRVMRPQELSSNARPGAEVFFKAGTSIEDVRGVMDAFMARGMDGFTLAVDPRAKTASRPNGSFIGLRLQYVPEFDDTATPDNIEQLLQDKA
ncbi:hypothetical protein ACG9H4_19040, partial [Acinetobacter baumannii]|uniref:hypothetical protein n=1 Tax=Acinetobacter baumannii TaxID=470 RepID=UPI003AF8F337